MSLKWVDVLEIAIQLAESKPEVDPRYVNFVDLHQWVLALPEFSDCLLYTSPSPRDATLSRMPSSA